MLQILQLKISLITIVTQAFIYCYILCNIYRLYNLRCIKMEENIHERKNDEEHHKVVHRAHREHSAERSFDKDAKTVNPKSIVWTLGIISVILSILFITSLATQGFTKGSQTISSKNWLSEKDVETKVSSYLNTALQGQSSSISSIKDEGDLYAIKLNIGGKAYDSYARKDGSLLFPQGIDLSQNSNTPSTASAPTPQQTNVPKTDKPTVELFVMSHCPYGTQAEKGILPAVRTLGDKVDFKVKFVYYAMHGQKEVDEQLNQYCIQKEQNDKYLPYLACFLNASQSEGCLKTAKVDVAKMNTCVKATDTEFSITKSYNDQSTWLSGRFPLFNTDAADNKKYGVGGSPTLIINGVQSNAGRDSASYLSAICNAMTNKAPECNTQLSTQAEGPGFGYGSTAAATAAGCGVPL